MGTSRKHRNGTCLAALALAFSLVCAVFAAQFEIPFGTWHRVSNEPILAPHGNGWESAGTFNPA